MDKELEALREVRSLLQDHWTAGSYHYLNNYCLVGGINKVTGIRFSTDSSEDPSSVAPWRRNKIHIRRRVIDLLEEELWRGNGPGELERFNDWGSKKEVLQLLDDVIAKREKPKDMEIGKPEKEYTVEPAEPIPGIEESPAPTPEPRKEPAKPEREKVPA